MRHRHSLAKPVLLLAILVAFLVLARVFHLGGRLGELRAWIQSLGTLGPVVYLSIYIAAVVLAIPGSVISIMAGVMFGSFLGVVLVSVGSTIGAGLAFLIARHLAREAVAERMERNPRFHRLDLMTEQHGSIIVAITRLVPLFPFNLLNYGFGLTRVRFRVYLFWSWLCMLPGTILYVVGADTVARTAEQGRIPWLLIGILALTLTIITMLVREARKKMSSKEDDSHDHIPEHHSSSR